MKHYLYLLWLQGLAFVNCVPLPQSDGVKPGVSPVVKGAASYLAKYGYATKDFADSDPTESSMKDFLRNFQYYADIPTTGRLDNVTLKKMEEPRCGMKDPKIKIKVKRSKRYVLYGTSWNSELKADRTLTWKVLNSGSHFDMPTVRRIMYYALDKWSKAANINFKESQSDDADFLVSFRSSYHGDPWSFDGRGGTLAHAFYPYPGAASSGDIHFDDDEDFTFGKSYGTDVLWVAVHEAGHSLGLEHSQELDAVMYPWYRGSTGKDFDLRLDDVQGIQALYGSRPVTTQATTIEATTTELVRPPLPTTQATTTEAPTTKTTEIVRPPLPTTQATTTEAPTTELVRPPLPTTQATTTEAPTTKTTEVVRPLLPTTQATTTEAPTTKTTEVVRPPLPTTQATTTEALTTKTTEVVRPPLPTTQATTTEAPTTKTTEVVRPPLPTTQATTTEAPTTKTTEVVRPPLPTTQATTTEAPTTELVRPPLPTTQATTTEAPTTKTTEVVRPPLPTTQATTTEALTTKTTEVVRPPLPTTQATTTEAPTTKTTEVVRPPLPTTQATTTEAPTTKTTEVVRPPLPTTQATTTEAPTTELVRPPLPTTQATTTETPTRKTTEVVRPPLPTTQATTSKSPTTKERTSYVTSAPLKTTKVTDLSCPERIDAAVIIRSGWLVVFFDDYFYLVSQRGREYGPLKIIEYFRHFKGKVSAAYKRKDDKIVLFAGSKYYVYNNFKLVEEAQPVTNYGLPAGTTVDAALVWPGNRYANWRQGDKVYLFSSSIYYRYDTRLKTIDRTYPKVISKLWVGLPGEVSAAFAGTSFHKWGTHFFRSNQFYLFNDRRVHTFRNYPANLKKFLNC